MNSPITVSCISSDARKTDCFHANRLILSCECQMLALNPLSICFATVCWHPTIADTHPIGVNRSIENGAKSVCSCSNRHPHALPARTLICLFNGQSRATTSVDAATTQSSSHASSKGATKHPRFAVRSVSVAFCSLVLAAATFQCLNHCSRANLQHPLPYLGCHCHSSPCRSFLLDFVPIASLNLG